MTTGQTAGNDTRPTAAGPTAPSANWVRPVAVLALGSFAMGTDSFVLGGILPQIAHGLNESTGAAGQVITAFSLTYAVSAPFLASFTSKLPRKPLMAFALALFVLANVASAAAPTLTLLLIARVVAGLGAALYTPNASAAAAALAGPARRGQALAVILGGLTVGTVFGVPIGTAIGQHVSWQASLLFVAAVGAVALLGLLVTLPTLPLPPAVALGERLRVLTHGRVVAIVSFMLLASASSIVVYTYIATVLRQTAGITGTTLAVTLLLWGAGGTVGAFGSGWLSDRFGPERTLILAGVVLIVTTVLLSIASTTPLVMIIMIVNGAAAWAAATPNNHRLTALMPHLPSVVISFNASGIYFGQALGAALGGVLIGGGLSGGKLCLTGAGLGVLALLVHLLIGKPKQLQTA
ncbi:MFS transporter [Streptomyces polygonati]|uniref:MFS transporter n=1 Tax=Streptomyces polygonati TaxID=1617087 RepID=A0ABV8HUD3_9ACTN